MKYRIKIITYHNGRKEYIPQVKIWWRWNGLTIGGEECAFYNHEYRTRETALECIDLHFQGNSRKQWIDFEYINITN